MVSPRVIDSTNRASRRASAGGNWASTTNRTSGGPDHWVIDMTNCVLQRRGNVSVFQVWVIAEDFRAACAAG
jgi:hypothetical protein